MSPTRARRRHIALNERGEQQQRLFHTFSEATVARWDEHARLLVGERRKKKEAPKIFRKQIFQAITKLEERLSEEDMKLWEKKHSLQRMGKDRRYAKMEQGREVCC